MPIELPTLLIMPCLKTNRRREKQALYNQEHGIEPQSVVKTVAGLTELVARANTDGRQAHGAGDDIDQNWTSVRLDDYLKKSTANYGRVCRQS